MENKQKLVDPQLLQFYIEGETRSWLKKEAKKKRISMSQIIRHWLNYARNHVK